MISVDYEVACQCIGQLIAEQVAILAAEEAAEHPNPERIALVDTKRKALVAARDALGPERTAEVADAIAVYGRQANQLNAASR